MVQGTHNELMQTTDNISLTLAQIMLQARLGMAELNNTVSDMRDSFTKASGGIWTRTLWQWFQQSAIFILRGMSYASVPKYANVRLK